MFNIAGSDEGLPNQLSDSSFHPHPYSSDPYSTGTSQNTSITDITRVTESTCVSDISINIDHHGGKMNGGERVMHHDSLDDKLDDTDDEGAKRTAGYCAGSVCVCVCVCV